MKPAGLAPCRGLSPRQRTMGTMERMARSWNPACVARLGHSHVEPSISQYILNSESMCPPSSPCPQSLPKKLGTLITDLCAHPHTSNHDADAAPSNSLAMSPLQPRLLLCTLRRLHHLQSPSMCSLHPYGRHQAKASSLQFAESTSSSDIPQQCQWMKIDKRKSFSAPILEQEVAIPTTTAAQAVPSGWTDGSDRTVKQIGILARLRRLWTVTILVAISLSGRDECNQLRRLFGRWFA